MRFSLGVVIAVCLACGAVAAPFAYGPYGGAPTAETVVVSWSSDTPLPARVEYGTLSEYDVSGTLSEMLDVPLDDSSTLKIVSVTLSTLAPNTTYVYRVVLLAQDGEVESPLGRFVTAPPPGQTIRFAVVSDTQWQWEGDNRLEVVGDAIAQDETSFDFILHAGDIVESPATTYWDHWFASFGDMLLKAPFIPVLGNHENSHRSYYENFTLPPGGGKNDERWWALHWGDVVVVGLDSTNLKVADYIAQQEWARFHLSGSEPHKFVVFHYPVFSSDAFHGDGYSYDVIFHPIFVETGVDIVFNGHAHNYERIERDGVVYLVVGGGGAVPRALADTLVEGSIVATEGYNFYTSVTASASGIDVDVISVAQASDDIFVPTDGHLLDAFSLSDADVSSTSAASWSLILAALLGAIIAGLLLVRALK
jgi:predicted phosphodiesterase